MATKVDVQKAIGTNGFEFGLDDSHEVVTHSRGTTWVVQNSKGQKVLVTLTDGGKHVLAVTEYKAKKPAKKAEEITEVWEIGSVKIGRNEFRAYRSWTDGRIERINKDGERVAYTGTAKFVAA